MPRRARPARSPRPRSPQPRSPRPPRPPRPLTDRQERFVCEYLSNGRNATAAYRVAYNAGGMSDATARVNACRLLRDVRIVERVAAVVQAVQLDTEITVATTLRRLWEEANRDDDNASHGARVSALKAVGLHLGMFVKETRVTGPDGGPIKHEDVAPVLTEEQIAARLRRLFEKGQERLAAGDSRLADELTAGAAAGRAFTIATLKAKVRDFDHAIANADSAGNTALADQWRAAKDKLVREISEHEARGSPGLAGDADAGGES
jgi:hypothetical protein